MIAVSVCLAALAIGVIVLALAVLFLEHRLSVLEQARPNLIAPSEDGTPIQLRSETPALDVVASLSINDFMAALHDHFVLRDEVQDSQNQMSANIFIVLHFLEELGVDVDRGHEMLPKMLAKVDQLCAAKKAAMGLRRDDSEVE